MIHYNFKLLDAPFDRRKNIDPIVGAALIGAGASFVSGMMSSSSSSAANQHNIEAVRETNASNEWQTTYTNDTNRMMNRYTNETNKQIAADNRKFQLEQWNRENDYNKPLAQMQRLKEAGLNPILAMSDGVNTGQASALSGSLAQTPPAVAPHDEIGAPAQPALISPTDYSIIGQIPSSINQMAQAYLTRQQGDAQSINNRYLDQDWRLQFQQRETDILKQLEDKKLSSAQRYRLIEELEYNRSIRDLQRQNLQLDLGEAQQRIAESKERALNYLVSRASTQFNDWLAAERFKIDATTAQATLQEIASRVTSNYASADLSKASAATQREQAKKIAEETIKTKYEANHQHITNLRASQMADKALELLDSQIMNYDASTVNTIWQGANQFLDAHDASLNTPFGRFGIRRGFPNTYYLLNPSNYTKSRKK